MKYPNKNYGYNTYLVTSNKMFNYSNNEKLKAKETIISLKRESWYYDEYKEYRNIQLSSVAKSKFRISKPFNGFDWTKQ